MNSCDLGTRRVAYFGDAHLQVQRLINEERNAYAASRLLGQSQNAWEIKSSLHKRIDQLRAEYKAELHAIAIRRNSVKAALKLLDTPISWPLWPELNHLSHEDVMDDLMRGHRERFLAKLERTNLRKRVAATS